MNTPQAEPAAPVRISPSRFVRVVFGPLTGLLNPVIVKLAGRRHVRFAAQIHHTGRRSGRCYVTPASARLAGDTFFIPLTFGNGSDWSRNVRAAGGCTIRLNGIDYRAVRPRLVDREQAMQAGRPAFNRVERITFRVLGIRQFLLLQRAPGDRRANVALLAHALGEVARLRGMGRVVVPDVPRSHAVASR